MFGTIVNATVIIIGSILGLIFKKGIPKRITDSVIPAFGLITLYLGIEGAFEAQNIFVLIISIALGVILGEAIDFDEKFERFSKRLDKYKKEDTHTISEGFITASLLFCTGAMAIVGSLESGLIGDHSMILTKSTLDFIISILLAASLGIGVMLSSASVFIYQGAIVLLATLIAPILPPEIVTEISAVGSILLMGLALNLIGIANLKVMNYIPAVFMPIIVYPIINLIMN